MPDNILNITDRAGFREWLAENHDKEKECRIEVKRGRPVDDLHFWYIDAVEEALCFGWIDSTVSFIDGRRMQRFSPRQKKSSWTELNKGRARRLEKLGLMADAGRAVLPPMGPRSFKFEKEVEKALKEARVWSKFRSLPPLYQRVRAYNLTFYRHRLPEQYNKMLQNTIEKTREGKTIGEWNDYGRLIDY